MNYFEDLVIEKKMKIVRKHDEKGEIILSQSLSEKGDPLESFQWNLYWFYMSFLYVLEIS